MKQLANLVLQRLEDKHRNITDVFRFLDQRGIGKVRKSDFLGGVERMRISLAREDAAKVWTYLDFAGKGYIQVQDLSVAYANNQHNFNMKAEVAINNAAMKNVAKQAADDEQRKVDEPLEIDASILEGKPPAYKGFKSSRVQPKANLGRSPLVSKSIDHTFGCKNLPSDEIGKLVSNKFMEDAAHRQMEKEQKLAEARMAIPKGLRQKQTVTSLMRKEVSKQLVEEYKLQASPTLLSPGRLTNASAVDAKKTLGKRNASLAAVGPKAEGGKVVLPPLQKVPLAKQRLASRQSGKAPPQADLSLTVDNTSRAGAYSSSKLAKQKAAHQDRVLFPTQVKESFLERNRHLASQKMTELASQFAMKSL